MLNQKSLLISAAVLATFTLTITGCGKSKESRSGSPAATAAQNQTEERNLNDLSDTENLDSELPRTVIEGVKELPKSVNGQNSAEGSLNQLPKSGENSVGGNTSNSLPQAGHKNKKQNAAVEVQFNETEAVKTGGMLDKLNFTSAGNDLLMAEFRGYNNKVAGNQKTMNLNLAKAVVNAKLTRATTAGGGLVVDLTLDESLDGIKKITTYKLQGKSSDAGDRQILKRVSSNGDLEYQGGFLKCIDSDGGCENAYIKIKLSGAYVRVIFSNASADRFFITEQGSQGSSFNLWNTYVMNTANMASTSQRLSDVKTSSFEVVNGRSAMGVLITTEDNDSVGLSVPLLVADKGTVAGSAVMKANDLSKNYDLPTAISTTQNLAQAINSAKLINNNGKGAVRIYFDLTTGSQKGAMWLTLATLKKSTLSTSDVSAFENKIPKF